MVDSVSFSPISLGSVFSDTTANNNKQFSDVLEVNNSFMPKIEPKQNNTINETSHTNTRQSNNNGLYTLGTIFDSYA